MDERKPVFWHILRSEHFDAEIKEIKKYRKKYRDSRQRLFCEKTTQKNQECLQKSQENVCDGVFFLSQIAVFGP